MGSNQKRVLMYICSLLLLFMGCSEEGSLGQGQQEDFYAPPAYPPAGTGGTDTTSAPIATDSNSTDTTTLVNQDTFDTQFTTDSNTSDTLDDDTSGTDTQDTLDTQPQGCAASPCDFNASCTEANGAVSCECNDGWQGDGYLCADIDECQLGIDDCDSINGTCTNTQGSYTCGCNIGYYLDTDGKTCLQDAACTDGNTRAGSTPCGLNNNGYFQQLCVSGAWQNTTNCTDPDSCVIGNTRAGSTPCGNNGTLEQECIAGAWQNTTNCLNEDPEPGQCQQGSSSTVWATNCPTSGASCVQGTWVAGGPDPSNSHFTLVAESEHFAIYSDEFIEQATAQSALDTLENVVWATYFGHPVYFKEPLCDLTTKYKAAIHIHSGWGLSGGAWRADRMGMWMGPGALRDNWGMAHEFMHSVQSVSGGMQCGGNQNYCGWVYESHANLMPHQLEQYRGDVHCSELFVNSTHKHLGSLRDRYCNWQFMEYLKNKHCYNAVNEIWTAEPANDPFTQIMRTQGWNIEELNDFLGRWAMHNITWDYQNPPPTTQTHQGATYRNRYGLITNTSRPERRQRITRLEALNDNWAQNRRFVTNYHWAPQRWGYNVVQLHPESNAESVRVSFKGVVQSGANSEWRWGLVATDANLTTARYSSLQKGTTGDLNFCVNSGELLWLVVMATPSQQVQINWNDHNYSSLYRYPWMIEVQGAWPGGFQGGQKTCAQGTPHSNGGGCVTVNVPASVYVGPYAQVLGGTLSGNARIEDHAVILGGTISGGTVGGLTIMSNFTVSDSASVKSNFYPIDFFGARSATGTVQLLGDLEYRVNKSSGTFSGFVDANTNSVSITEVTIAPPYSW